MVSTGELILRLVLAGLLGGIIGFEREARAKGAGIRTHFLVALASALFMLISQYGFDGSDRYLYLLVVVYGSLVVAHSLCITHSDDLSVNLYTLLSKFLSHGTSVY